MSWQLFHLNSKQGPRPQPLGPPEAIITNSIFFLTSPDIGKNVSVWTSDNMPTVLTKGWQWPCTVFENFHQELSTEEEFGAVLINLSRTHKKQSYGFKATHSAGYLSQVFLNTRIFYVLRYLGRPFFIFKMYFANFCRTGKWEFLWLHNYLISFSSFKQNSLNQAFRSSNLEHIWL